MPIFTKEWIDYCCDNPKKVKPEQKNEHFVEAFLSTQQQERVGKIFNINNLYSDNKITNYRKITAKLLELMPNLAYAVPGWSSYPDTCKPLLVAGKAYSDGKINPNTRVRLHYLDGQYFLIARNDAQLNNINYDNTKNPLSIYIALRRPMWKGINDEGIYLGPISTEKNIKFEPGVEEFLTQSNAINNDHAPKFAAKRAGYCLIPKHLDERANANVTITTLNEIQVFMKALNTILYGPPGTGKTFGVTESAINIVYGSNEDEISDDYNARFLELQRKGQIEFTTFHQNYAYEDFIEGLRAEYKEKSVVYDIEPGILKRIAYRAMYAWLTGEPADFENDPTQKEKVLKYLKSGAIEDEKKPEKIPNYVLIIDEINRGNVARIFGELITLVEDSKRARRPGEAGNGYQPLLATLPYTKEPFILPPNLYIIGTMNTADRSLIGLDAALRRRFFFEEMPPKPRELKNQVIDGVNLETFLTQLNERILTRDVRDHCIGHAYFMEVKSLDDLANVMRYKVIPQLQEYFHDRLEDLHQLLQFGNDSFVDQNGQTNEAFLTNSISYQNFCAP